MKNIKFLTNFQGTVFKVTLWKTQSRQFFWEYSQFFSFALHINTENNKRKIKYLSVSKSIQVTNLKLWPIYTVKQMVAEVYRCLNCLCVKKPAQSFKKASNYISFVGVSEWKMGILVSLISILWKFVSKTSISCKTFW